MFEWKDNFSVNVKQIDKQHKRLFEIGHIIFEKVKSYDKSEDEYDEIIKILEELKEYTIYHFKCEEELMEKYNFKGLEEHKKQHDYFISKIPEFKNQDIYIKQDKAMMNILNFLVDWISTHILKSDMNYKECFNENGLY